jgi:hypothetical protein
VDLIVFLRQLGTGFQRGGGATASGDRGDTEEPASGLWLLLFLGCLASLAFLAGFAAIVGITRCRGSTAPLSARILASSPRGECSPGARSGRGGGDMEMELGSVFSTTTVVAPSIYYNVPNLQPIVSSTASPRLQTRAVLSPRQISAPRSPMVQTRVIHSTRSLLFATEPGLW